MEKEERVIQAGDRLTVSFGAKDDQAAAVFNKYGGVLTSGTDLLPVGNQANSELLGYLIDADGKIEFPIIGRIKAAGLTALQLKDTLTRQVDKFLKNPLVTVRFVTFKITVLGEVRSPGVYELPMQRTSVLDALGVSGDLPRSAKRYDIQIYSEHNGQRTIRRIDLRTKNFLYDPGLFWLKNNDVIYVQPRPGRVFREDAGFYASLVSIGIGIATLLIVK